MFIFPVDTYNSIIVTERHDNFVEILLTTILISNVMPPIRSANTIHWYNGFQYPIIFN